MQKALSFSLDIKQKMSYNANRRQKPNQTKPKRRKNQMRLFYDMESDMVITESQLKEEMETLIANGNIEPMTFEDYVRECTGKNGTLKRM